MITTYGVELLTYIGIVSLSTYKGFKSHKRHLLHLHCNIDIRQSDHARRVPGIPLD